ncbi:MAG: 2-C-methyl-D-erythritol 4-phosphate cytidylyltransferase [Planctomycetes bacterium]|nr:2-C-methyl-D-erythritol 4-phosphate cytidylyltransferase [Planctomycetota bacterium]
MRRDVGVVIPAAGIGKRMGTRAHKPLLEVGGRPILFHTLDRFREVPEVREIVLALHADDLGPLTALYGSYLKRRGVTAWVVGGARRQDSVECGLAALSPACRLVAVHDAVRPFVPAAAVRAAIARARVCGAVVLAVPAVDTLKRVDARSRVVETLPRREIWQVQTPQILRRAWLEEGFALARRDGVEVTDDAALAELAGRPVEVVPGAYDNLKITTPADLEIAAVLLARLRRARRARNLLPASPRRV